MVFSAAVLCILAVIWIVIRTRKPFTKPDFSHTDELLFDSEAPLDLFETAPIGYMEIDREGMVRRVNRLECKLRGVEQNAMLGVHCAELIPEIDRARYREQIQRRIQGHTALVAYQREYAREGGIKITVEVHEELLRNKDGAIAGLRMASIERHRAQE